VTNSCLSFSIVGEGELGLRYFRIPLGFIDGEETDGEMLVSVTNSWPSCVVVANVALEPRYLKMPLDFSGGDTAAGGMLMLWRAVGSAFWSAPGWLIKKCCIDFVP